MAGITEASAAAALKTASNNAHPQWWKDPGLRKLNIILLSAFLGSIVNGYDSSLISGLEAIPRWTSDLGLEDSSLLGLVIAAYAFGGLVAFFPAPWVIDKLGRRWGIFIGNVCIVAATVGQAFTKTAVQFLGTRLIIGFFSIFVSISSSALLSELAHPRQRAVVGALYNTFFFVGSITAAWTSFGSSYLDSVWSWRIPVLLQVSWNLIQLAFLSSAPESPRWLSMKGRGEEAKKILAKYHANGDLDDELVNMEYAEICTSVELAASQEVGWLALFATPGNRKRVFLCIGLGLSIQWVGNGIVSYYFAPVLKTVGITSSTQQNGINGGLQVYNWCLSIVGALLAERAGRRKLFLISTSAMLLFMVLVLTCSAVYANTGSEASGGAVIAFLFLFLGGYVLGLTPIPILYINEIWPTTLRAKGTSIFWLSQTAALCFNQYVNPVALNSIGWKYYFVYVGVLIADIAFFYFYVPETKGKSLEEVAGIFDGRYAAAIAHSSEQAQHNKAELEETMVEHVNKA